MCIDAIASCGTNTNQSVPTGTGARCACLATFVAIGNNCACPGSLILSTSGTTCVESCAANEYLNLDGTQCVTDCSGFPNSEPKNGKCVCQPGYHLDMAGACVDDAACSSLSIAHPYDAEMCACPTGYVIDSNGDCAPVCDYSNGEYVHVDTYGRKMCVTECPLDTYVSGRTCVTSCGTN